MVELYGQTFRVITAQQYRCETCKAMVSRVGVVRHLKSERHQRYQHSAERVKCNERSLVEFQAGIKREELSNITCFDLLSKKE